MFSKLTGLFKNKANLEEIAYLEAQNIQWDAEQGYIVDGILLNDVLAERLIIYPTAVCSSLMIWHSCILQL